MRTGIANNRRRSKKGTTLVELVVAMALTAIFAVTCVALINPIERVYQRTEKLSRAELIADTVIDAIRKECDDIKNDDMSSAWIAEPASFDSDAVLFNGPDGMKITAANAEGQILLIKKNNSYCEAIYACLPVTEDNKTDANKNNLDGTNTGHAVDKLFEGSEEDKTMNTSKGVVHFGYYQATDKGDGVYPLKSYDYTNPIMAASYNGYYVKLKFKNLTSRTENGETIPSFVQCTVEVYEGEYSDDPDESSLIYYRSAPISFSANGSAPGSSYIKPVPEMKDVKVTVIWDDDHNAQNKRPAINGDVVIKLKYDDKEASHIIPLNKDTYTFTFSNIEAAAIAIEQNPVMISGYKPAVITQNSDGSFTVINSIDDVKVKLIPGPDFDSLIKAKKIVSIRFGSRAELERFVPDFDSGYVKVSIDEEGDKTDDYRLFFVPETEDNTRMRAFVICKEGSTFIANEDCSQMFANCDKLEYVSDIGLLETSNTYTMEKMFYNCNMMKQFDVTGLIDDNDSLTVSAESMFEGCTVAQEVCFNDCATSRISSMKRMFFNYSVLSAHEKDVLIDLSGFKFDNCTDMSEMFSNNKNSRTVIDEIIFPAGHIDMPKVTTMEQMFYKGSGIQKITNFNDMTCNKLETITCMFDYCSAITELDMHDFKMPNCELQMKYGTISHNSAFKGCTKLEKIILDGWDVRTSSNMRDFFSNSESLKTVSMKGCYMPNIVSVEGLFIYDHVLENVYMDGFVKDKCRSIRSIFNQCYKLKNIDISGWDTKNVDTMRDAFYQANRDCDTPLDVDLSEFSFLSATDFYRMFYQSGVHSVTFPTSSPSNPIIVGKYHNDTDDARVEDKPSNYHFSDLFYKCERLTTVNNFNISYEVCVNASNIFYGCHLLGSESGNKVKYYIAVPGATSAENLFYDCQSLKQIDISGSQFNSVSNFKNTFNTCPLLTTIIMEDVNLSSASLFSDFFKNSPAVETLKWNGIILGAAQNLNFTNISSVKYFYLSGAKLTGLTSIEKLFISRKSLVTVDFSDVTLPDGLDSAYQMFMGCENLENIKVDNFKSPRSLREMFRNCYKVKNFDLSKIDTTNTESMYGMFQGCTGLETVNFDGITATKLKTMDLMFSGCTKLKTVIFSTSADRICGPSDSALQIFNGCINIEEVDGFKAPADCTEMFKDCNQTTEIVLANWDTSAVTNMSKMFYGCYNLKTIDLGSFNTSSVINMSGMFQSCSVLCFDSSTWEDWDTSNVTNMSYMFKDCCYDYLKTNSADLRSAYFYINISNFSFASVTDMSNMFTCGTVKNVDYKYDILDTIIMPDGINGDGNAPNVTNIMYLFMWRSNTTEVRNLEHFTTTNKVTKARSMFSRLGVSVLDVRGLDFSGTDNSDDGSSWIFDNCENLVTIYADPDKNYIPTKGSGMFGNCKKIKGGAGTTFLSGDKKYAKIDGGKNKEGYFTDYHLRPDT